MNQSKTVLGGAIDPPRIIPICLKSKNSASRFLLKISAAIKADHAPRRYIGFQAESVASIADTKLVVLIWLFLVRQWIGVKAPAAGYHVQIPIGWSRAEARSRCKEKTTMYIE